MSRKFLVKFSYSNKIFQKSNELNRTNKLLRSKYENDEKYLRLHKRLMEKNLLSNDEQKLYRILCGIKRNIDNNLVQNKGIMRNESYLERMFNRLILGEIKEESSINFTPKIIKDINVIIPLLISLLFVYPNFLSILVDE